MRCYRDARKEQMREDAMMYFKTASIVARLVGAVFNGGKGANMKLMDEYSWLWSDQDRRENMEDQLMMSLFNNTKGGGKSG